MTQEAIQITETPPLPGLKLVQDTNKALQTIATDFAGETDPAALAGPFMTWADTANMLLKRRNEANTAWVTQHALDPIATQDEVDTGTIDTKFVTPLTLWGWVKQATESVFGMAKVASQADVDTGTDDETMVTPKKLRFGFAFSSAAHGYIVFPSWLGGLIIQWRYNVAGGSGQTIDSAFPMPFPNNLLMVVPTINAVLGATNGVSTYVDTGGTDQNQVRVGRRFFNNGGSVGVATQDFGYIAIGR